MLVPALLPGCSGPPAPGWTGCAEAERCDELVCIAYRHALARGTAASIVAEAGARDLEDAFVRLVGQASDNFAEAG